MHVSPRRFANVWHYDYAGYFWQAFGGLILKQSTIVGYKVAAQCRNKL
jgi:hypothetical protein